MFVADYQVFGMVFELIIVVLNLRDNMDYGFSINNSCVDYQLFGVVSKLYISWWSTVINNACLLPFF